MDLGLSGRVALVTGASRGLGRAIALGLARQGMHVAATARDRDRLDALAGEVRAFGGRLLALPADLSLRASAGAVVAAAAAEFGQLHLLVNNAGATKRGDFLELSDDDWAESFELKFFGYVRMARSAWPHLRAANGTIVNIGGVGGRTGEAEFMVGGSVNAAIGLLSKALADRGVRDGVRVLAIHPGTFETDRFERRLKAHMAAHGLSAAQARDAMLQDQAVARFGRPEELAALIAMLASDRVAFLHGAIIDMDGGQTRTV